jgi:hypothetical protein
MDGTLCWLPVAETNSAIGATAKNIVAYCDQQTA